ncbi:hypothetical protein DRQ53_01930 [bacterium]|nr:MAG: hypothetical protein DRQ32_01065 [bacterium]RKZ17944.1 MAG: hypothetical protein DRQ53_01930 [bacterium]
MRVIVFGLLSFYLLVSLVAPGARAECSPSDVSSAEQSFSTAQALGQAGQWTEAIPSLERALESCPELSKAVQLMAYAQMRAKDYGLSATYFQRYINDVHGGVVSDTSTDMLRAYGYVLLKLKNWSGAVTVYESVLAQDPNNKEAHERLVNAYTASGNIALGIPHLEALYSMSAGDEQSRNAKRVGAAYRQIGEEANAKEWDTLAGGGTSGQFSDGLAHMGNKDWKRAAESFEGFIHGQPDNVSGLKNLGICYNQLGRKADAVEVYGHAWEVAPDRHDIGSSLAIAYSDLERWTDVASIAEPAVQNWPDDDPSKGSIYYLMGKVYEKRDGDYESAISMFEKARSDPHWGSFAVREISRQQQLIEIRDSRRG